jgi:hypothetical protein
VRAPEMRLLVAVVAGFAVSGCVSAEAHNSGDSSGGGLGYNVLVPSRLTRVQPGGISRQLSVSGSAAAASSSSDWEWGAGLRAAPGYPLGQTGMTIHPMGSYTYLKFDGGHDDRFELGGQIRRTLTPRTNGSGGLWIGAEAAGAVLRESLDNVDGSNNTNGWSATALLGAPVSDSKWGVNLYGGVGYSYYGGSGVNIRAGIDLQPWFLKQ